jgi:arylsulfatase A-like enzyme
VNVVYIDIDSLRPDHVGSYGYDAPTTPRLDEFAEDAVRFERAYVANSPCMPSRAALLSGRHGISNGVATHGEAVQVMSSPQWENGWDEPSSDHWTLPELFFKNRVRTGAISSFPRHPSPWFYHLWHEFHQPQEPDNDELEYFQTPRAEQVTDLATDFLDRHDDEEFLLYTQYWDPHAPYKRSDEEVDRFRGEYLPEYPTQEMIDEHGTWDAFRSAKQLGIEDRDDLDDLVSNYDAEIRYADEHVGRLLDELRERDLYDETLIVVTADHGEEFGEHGLYREHWSTHDGTQRVPLLVKPPASESVTPGARDHLVTNVDLPATLADYAGLDAPAGWQGRSLRSVVEDASADWRDSIVVDHGLYTAQRAVRTDRWKYIRTYHPGMWGGVVPEKQLFDMHADPWEQKDVADDHPEVVASLDDEMARWTHEHVGRAEDALHRVARIGPRGYQYAKDGWDGV